MRFIFCLLFVTGNYVTVAQYSKDWSVLRTEMNKAKTERELFNLYDQIFLKTYYESGTRDSAQLLSICDTMQSIAKKLNNDSLLARTFILYDVYYGSDGQSGVSFDYMLKAKKLGYKVKYTDVISAAFKEAASLYKDVGFYTEALHNLHKAEEFISDKTSIFTYYQPNRVYYHLAEIYAKLNNFDSALKYVAKAQRETDASKDPYGYAKIMNSLALTYAIRNYAEAESKFKEAISFCTVTNLRLPLITSLNDLANLYFTNKKIEQARVTALQAFSTSQQISNKRNLIRSAEILQHIYKTSKFRNSDSVIHYLNIVDSLRKKLFDGQKIDQANVGMRLFEEETTRENEVKQEASLQKRKNIYFFGIAFTVITCLFFLLLFSQTVLLNKRLILFFGNLSFLLFFEFIYLILHHFIVEFAEERVYLEFLFMVLVALTLFPLHHKIQKEIVEKLIKRNKNIRLQIAKKILEETDDE